MIHTGLLLGAFTLSLPLFAIEPAGSSHALSLPDGRGELAIQIAERTATKSRPLQLDRVYQPIDPRSQLIVSLSAPEPTLRTPLIDRWILLAGVLEQTNQLLDGRKAIVALAATTRKDLPNQVAELQKASKRYGSQYIEFRKKVRQHLGDETFKKIDSEANQKAKQGVGFLETLADWVQLERAALHKDTSGILEITNSTVTVYVEAFLDPKVGESRQVHVAGYDNIAAGRSSTIEPKTGLALTPAQATELQRGYEMAQQAARTIREIRTNQTAVQEELQRLRDTLTATLEATISRTREMCEAWAQQFRNLNQALGMIESMSGDAGQAATRLRTKLSEVEVVVGRTTTTFESVADIQTEMMESLPTFLISLAAGPQSPANTLLQQVSVIDADLKSLPRLLKGVTDDLNVIISTLPPNIDAETARIFREFEKSTLNAILDSKERLGNQIPSLRRLILGVQQVTQNARTDENAVQKLAEANVASIPRNLNDLEEGKIRLREIGASKGDVLRVIVRLEGATQAGLPRVRSKEFDFEFQYTESYIDYSGQLVFAAPAQRPRRHDFQEGAAVLATFRMGFVDPKGFDRFLHTLDPGIGIHAAALNQGAATVETGLGVSVGVRDNLLSFGYGWNIGAGGNPYYFIGVGLIELLQQFKTVRPSNSK